MWLVLSKYVDQLGEQVLDQALISATIVDGRKINLANVFQRNQEFQGSGEVKISYKAGRLRNQEG